MDTQSPTKEGGTQSDVVSVSLRNPNVTTIAFDRPKLAALRTAYNQALADGEEQFVFEGSDLVADYAKYLIEYLDGRLA